MNGIVQISCLGKFGRTGNQLFQYAFARTYAEILGAALETPPWFGQVLFGLNDAPLSCCKPSCPEGHLKNVPPETFSTNVDLFGYFQTSYTSGFVSTSKAREWFTLKPEFKQMFPKSPDYYAACHLRQGDYLSLYSGTFCNIDKNCYLRAIQKNTPDAPIVWVEENKAVQTTKVPPELAWLPDFMTLYNSDILYRANSTFSLWAGILGQVPKIFSPNVEDKYGPHDDVEFEPGNRCRWYTGDDHQGLVFRL